MSIQDCANEKIGIDTGWDLVGLAERPVSFTISIFLWKKFVAPYITILSRYVIAG